MSKHGRINARIRRLTADIKQTPSYRKQKLLRELMKTKHNIELSERLTESALYAYAENFMIPVECVRMNAYTCGTIQEFLIACSCDMWDFNLPKDEYEDSYYDIEEELWAKDEKWKNF